MPLVLRRQWWWQRLPTVGNMRVVPLMLHVNYVILRFARTVPLNQWQFVDKLWSRLYVHVYVSRLQLHTSMHCFEQAIFCRTLLHVRIREPIAHIIFQCIALSKRNLARLFLVRVCSRIKWLTGHLTAVRVYDSNFVYATRPFLLIAPLS